MLCRISLIFCFAVSPAVAQLDFEREPINYSTSNPTDPVWAFARKLESGDVSLKWDERRGYLESLLHELHIPVSSQTLVFSKTSLQVHRITRHKPRAVYFNDDVYVGWVQNGDVIEVSRRILCLPCGRCFRL